jgi:signal transduction histidine kinase
VPRVDEDTTRLRHLQALTDTALAHLGLEELLAALLLRTRDALEADTCAILLLDEVREELVVRAAVGIEEEVEQGVRIPLGQGFAGRIAAERRPAVLEQVDVDHVVNPVLMEKGIRSMLGVPLLVDGHPIGVLHVGTLTPRLFSPSDVELLELAAARAAIAIEHARLFEAERAARQRLEHVQAVTDAALAHLELDELLAVLLPRIRTILEADTCAVLLHDEESKELVARAALGIEEEVEQGVRIPMGRGFAGRIAAERQPVILNEVDLDHVVNPILIEKGLESMLGVPLLARDEIVGVLHVGRLVHRTFTAEDVDLLQLVAGRVALAIERARLHEQVVLLDRLKLNFVAIASHELRTPAASVYGALATVVERGDTLSPETRDALLGMAYAQGERLRRLLDQLLDLSRLDAQAISIEARPFELHGALSEIIAAAVPQEVALELDVDRDLVVDADPLVLDRVVSNLLVNAVRYGEPPIVVRAEQEDEQLRISVSDRGPGVPDELRPRLFERFARGQDVRGAGLGLSIARAYARAHGGDLVYEPGPEGSRFELLVPDG